MKTFKYTFDEMMALSPEELEDYRINEVNKAFADSSSPESYKKLKELQSKIDTIRENAETPLSCAEDLFSLMNSSKTLMLNHARILGKLKGNIEKLNADLQTIIELGNGEAENE